MHRYIQAAGIVLLLLTPLVLQGQYWREVVADQDNYFEIVDELDRYYAGRDRGRGSGYKQYMRWKGKMRYRIDADGFIRNAEAQNLRAYRRVQQMAAHTRNRATHGDWENLGPFDYTAFSANSQGGLGRVNCMAFHPTNSQIMWAGTAAGGLWHTTDGGGTWSPKTEVFASIGISGIAIDHTDPDTWYILTGDGDGFDTRSVGVMKTTDGGVTWDPTGLSYTVTQSRYGYTLMMHPVDPDILLVGMRSIGIFRTDDGGDTWTQVESGKHVWDIEFKPGSPDTIYAASSAGFLISTDTGQSWSVDNDPSFPVTFSRMAIAVSPALPERVYAIFGGNTGTAGMFNGAYRSFDSGNTFAMSANTPNILDATAGGTDSTDQATYDLALAVDPADGFTLYSGGINVWKSNDAGVIWNRKTWWTRAMEPSSPYVHADFHNLYFVADTLYAANDGGIYRSTNGGNDWTEISQGICMMQFYEIDAHNNEWLGGTQDNGTNLAGTGATSCDHLLGGDGFASVWHTGDGSIKYITSQNSLVRRQFGSNIIIWEETDGFWFCELEMHTTDPDYFFISKGRELFRGNQAGAIWDFNFDSLGTLNVLDSTGIWGFDQCVSNPDVMYIAAGAHLLKTTNLSAANPTWDTLPNPMFGLGMVSDVVVDPDDPDRVWITASGYSAGNKVFFSSTGGMFWANISGDLPNVPVRCIVYHPGSDDDIYIGTEIGVFFKDASLGIAEWLYYSTYLPNTIVSDLVIENGYVYAGTFGRG
ncbi:MAG: hypothetical protein R3301_18470, partial [Saprospiraceae bacterium]|nr:hypothetical protein [Saprospiraceae bacterium]